MSLAEPASVAPRDLRQAMQQRVWLAIGSFFLLLAGAFVALLVFERYQPLDAGRMIRSFSLGLLVLWGLLAWKSWEVLRNPGHGRGATWGLLVPVMVPWVFAGFLWLNGALDRAPASRQDTVVVAKHASARDWLHAFRYEVVVRSWRAGRRLEGVLVRERERFDTYNPGDAVTVDVRPGFFRLAWIAGLEKR